MTYLDTNIYHVILLGTTSITGNGNSSDRSLHCSIRLLHQFACNHFFDLYYKVTVSLLQPDFS